MILKRIFGHKSVGHGECRRPHNQELLSFYSLPNTVMVIKFMRWTGHVARMVENRSAFKILKGKPTGKKLFF